ncbi:MAG: hypothetical protein JNG84_03025 [Archangium sp.]|nr:hypothetical protein [Archangium sp.]
MPDVSSRKFVETFQRAFASSGRLSEKDLTALKKVKDTLANPNDRAAAEQVLAMVRGDRELDAFEVAPVRKAMQVLAGVSGARLPADLERALANGVPVSNVTAKSYDLTFDVSGTGPDFPARAVVTLDKAAGKEAILEVNPDRLKIGAVKVNGRAVPFEVKNGRIHVKAPGAKAIEIQYTVKSVDAADDAFGLIRDKYTGRMWTLTWPYNTGALFPSNSAPADGATAKVTLQVANGFQGVSGGKAVGANSYLTTGESPSYGVAFYTAKDFALGNGGTTREGVKVEGYGVGGRQVPKSTRDAYLKTAKESHEYFTRFLGASGYGDSMRLVEVPGNLDGMEHACCVAIMLAATETVDNANETAAHEIGHHWFGNNVRIAEWGDFWMSEGFNSYITYRYFREAEGDSKYYELLDRGRDALRDELESNPFGLVAPPNTDVTEIFDSVPYEFGPWMLRMLEVQLGTPKFDALLRDWYGAKKQSAVSTKDFVAFVKQKTGKNVGPFFEAWRNIKAVPTFRAEIKTTQATGELTVKLTASTPFPKGLTVPLRLEGAGGKVLTVQVDPTKPFKVTPGFKVTKTTWDPERTVLALVR